MGNQHQQPAGGDDITKIGALSDGFANTSTNNSDVDDSNVGVGNGGNRDNTYTDNSQDHSVDVDANLNLNVATDNGNDRNNTYDWDYNSKSVNYSDNDNTSVNKSYSDNDSYTSTTNDNDVSNYSKSYSDNDTTTTTNTSNHTDNDTTTSNYSDNDTSVNTVSDAYNKAFSYSDDDFATLHDVKDIGNLGIANGDITFDLGSDFTFSMNVSDILNNSMNGDGNNSAFSAVQASQLSDQDTAYNLSMNNEGVHNDLYADGGSAQSGGMEASGECWDVNAGHDIASSATSNASAIIANSGVHMELVQGANLLTNSFDASSVGHDHNVSSVGDDAS